MRSRSPFSVLFASCPHFSHARKICLKSRFSIFLRRSDSDFVPFSKELFIFRFSETMAFTWGTRNCDAIYCMFSGKSNKSLSLHG